MSSPDATTEALTHARLAGVAAYHTISNVYRQITHHPSHPHYLFSLLPEPISRILRFLTSWRESCDAASVLLHALPAAQKQAHAYVIRRLENLWEKIIDAVESLDAACGVRRSGMGEGSGLALKEAGTVMEGIRQVLRGMWSGLEMAEEYDL